MNHSLNRYLSFILKRRLDVEAQRWLGALDSGFDVAVVSPDHALLEAVQEYLETSTKRFAAIRVPIIDGQKQSEAAEASGRQGVSVAVQKSKSQGSNSQLSLHLRPPRAGYAAIPFELPPLEELLPSPSAMVSQILSSTQLERYMDAFDGRKMALLKRVLDQSGPEVFFDAIVHVAYLAGYRGDDDAALAELERRVSEPPNKFGRAKSAEQKGPGAALADRIELGALFDKLIERPDPHDLLKAALAHYVFHGRKVTQSEASGILKVSRSTLQAHLQLAERLNVAEFFMC